MTSHLISRVTILGTGLIGGSFALALRKYTADVRISGWDRTDTVREAQSRGAIDEAFFGGLAPSLQNSDLIYIALPIAATLDLLPEIARHAPSHALITDACSTKVRITQAAAGLFPGQGGPLFLGGHPMAGRELSGIAHADADLFRGNTYALIGASPAQNEPRISAFVKILEKIGARPFWLGEMQHDYAVGLASHLPQLAAVALASFLSSLPSRSLLSSTTVSMKTVCRSPSPVPACAIPSALPAAPIPPGATSSSPIRKFSPPLSIFSHAASTIFASASPLANSKPILTPPMNSTNSSAPFSAQEFPRPGRVLHPAFAALHARK